MRKLGSWEVSRCGNVVGVTIRCGADFNEDVTTFGSWNGDLIYLVWFIELEVNFAEIGKKYRYYLRGFHGLWDGHFG